MPTAPADPEQTALVQSLFVQHLPALRGFVLSLISDFSLVDDVVQETFLVVTAKAASFQRGTNFRAWAWTIARYKVLQTLKRTPPCPIASRRKCSRRWLRTAQPIAGFRKNNCSN